VSAKPLPSLNNLPDRPLNADEMRELIRKAQEGRERYLPALRRLLKQHPALGRSYDDAANIRRFLAKRMCGRALYSAELLNRQAEELAAAVVGPNPSPIERLLGERVAIGWMQVQQADARLAHLPTDFDLRLADAVHRRYFAALKALAAYRKLPRAAVQVNIGEQQVNVSG
jgi:hypothetical protein